MTEGLTQYVVNETQRQKQFPKDLHKRLTDELAAAYHKAKPHVLKRRAAKIVRDATKKLMASPDTGVKGLKLPKD